MRVRQRGEKKRGKESQERFSEAACGKELEGKDASSKEKDMRKRGTGADRPKRKMCERIVRHRESQLFPISSTTPHPPLLEFSRISMLLLRDRTEYPLYLLDFNPV